MRSEIATLVPTEAGPFYQAKFFSKCLLLLEHLPSASVPKAATHEALNEQTHLSSAHLGAMQRVICI